MVLIEAMCVVIRRQAVEERYSGGWEAFSKSIPTGAFCYDDDLASVGFMDPSDATAFMESLTAMGLRPGDTQASVDYVGVQQVKGPVTPSPWLKFHYGKIEHMTLSLCFLADKPPKPSVCAPGHWKYEGSLSENPNILPQSAVGDRLRYLRREGGVEVYFDLQTNKEVYVARPTIGGDTPQALMTQIENVLHEALSIESKGPVPKPRFFGRPDPRYARVKNELLPQIDRIVNGPGREIPGAFLVLAVLYRILSDLPEAERVLLRGLAIDPTNVGIINDLVRCLGEQRRPHEALVFARKALQINPDSPATLGNVAACLLNMKEDDEAIRVIDRALSIHPDDQQNLRIRDILYRRRK